MTKRASPLRRMKAAVRKMTEGDEPMAEMLRQNGLRVRLEGDAILIEPFDMLATVKPNSAGAAIGAAIEGLRRDGET